MGKARLKAELPKGVDENRGSKLSVRLRSNLASGGEGRRDLAELIHRCWEEAVAMKSVSDYTASQGGEERGVTSFHPSKEDPLPQLDTDAHSSGTSGPGLVSLFKKLRPPQAAG